MNSMKRILLYLLLCLSISAIAQVSRTAIFDFADPTNLNPSVTPTSEIGADVEITGTTFTNKPKSVIRISLCRTAKRNPNDRFGFKHTFTTFCQHTAHKKYNFLPRYQRSFCNFLPRNQWLFCNFLPIILPKHANSQKAYYILWFYCLSMCSLTAFSMSAL